VVVGGSSGLGLVIAKAFADQGARLVLIARDSQRLFAARDTLSPADGSVQCLTADITSSADVESAFARIRHDLPSLDVLVNAAGRSDRSTILETKDEDFQTLWELNFLGPVRCTRAAAEMLISSRGHVVQLGSLASKIAARFLGAYPASKFALAAYSQQLRLELGPRGLHVLLVCPGPIARSDAGTRYDHLADGLPQAAREPAGGARLKAIEPQWLARRIIRACEKREAELVVPARARWLFAVSQLWPSLADRILIGRTGPE
jgi:short-subunit dehydrogenase